MNLLLLESEEVDGNVADIADARAEHLRRVWRVEPGQGLGLGIVDGPRGRGTVEEVDGARVRIRITSLEEEPPPRPAVDLLLAVPRPKVLKRLFAPLASLGVGRLLLTGAERVERFYFDSHAVTPELWRPRLLEGLAQVRDTRLPEVTVHRSLARLLEMGRLEGLAPDTERLVADVGAARPLDVPSPREVCSALPSGHRVLLAVGPEGGWTPAEMEMLVSRAFQPVRMGSRSLRSDVACISLLTLAHEGLRKE